MAGSGEVDFKRLGILDPAFECQDLGFDQARPGAVVAGQAGIEFLGIGFQKPPGGLGRHIDSHNAILEEIGSLDLAAVDQLEDEAIAAGAERFLEIADQRFIASFGDVQETQVGVQAAQTDEHVQPLEEQ